MNNNSVVVHDGCRRTTNPAHGGGFGKVNDVATKAFDLRVGAATRDLSR